MPLPRANPKLTVERANEAFRYDAESGDFTWAIKIARKIVPGQVAGTLSKKYGYWIVRIDAELHPVSRVIWLMKTGRWPVFSVDHINGDRADNRWANLREASAAENQRNRRGLNALKGVSHKSGKWVASLQKGKRRYYLGRHSSALSAARAYDAAATMHFGAFARLNFPAGV